jgi:hypothetical protein
MLDQSSAHVGCVLSYQLFLLLVAMLIAGTFEKRLAAMKAAVAAANVPHVQLVRILPSFAVSMSTQPSYQTFSLGKGADVRKQRIRMREKDWRCRA